MDSILSQLSLCGVIPVIKIDDASQAVSLARALFAGGITTAEVTFRTDAAAYAIRSIASECPNVLVGAGTVLDTAQCRLAIEAGARFIVTPGYVSDVVNFCREAGVPIIPGCASAADMSHAVSAGLEVVKFFPSETLGGLRALKAYAPVFPKLRFIPTGGVKADNFLDYLSYERVCACGGSWIVPSELLATGHFEEITALCRKTVLSMLDFRLAHVGINAENSTEAERIAHCFDTLLSLPTTATPISYFAGTAVEVMSGSGRGTMGHIGFYTRSIPRARAYFERMGVRFCESSARFDEKGNIKLIYFDDEISGFAVHLTQA